MLTDHPTFQALCKLPRDPKMPYLDYLNGNVDDINSYRIWFVDTDQPGALFMPYRPLRKDVIQLIFDTVFVCEFQRIHFRYMGDEYNTNCLKDPKKREQVLLKLAQDFIKFCETSGIGTKNDEKTISGKRTDKELKMNVNVSFREITEDGIVHLYSYFS